MAASAWDIDNGRDWPPLRFGCSLRVARRCASLATFRVDRWRRDIPVPDFSFRHTAIEESQVDQALFARFRKCAVEVLSVSEDQVVPDAKFGDDLDADSLDLVELVMALEEEFDVSVPEEELEGIETVGQAYELVAGKL
jgi:acyl carrier protein